MVFYYLLWTELDEDGHSNEQCQITASHMAEAPVGGIMVGADCTFLL